MADLTFAQLKAKLNLRIHDGSNIAFTDQEKTEFLTAAFQDGYVYIIDRDDSTTSTANTASYLVPDGIDKVTAISIDLAGDGFDIPIDRSSWRQVNGNIYFTYLTKGMPATKTLVMWGRHKLTTTDLIPDELQEYVLHLAAVTAYEYVLAKLTTRFVTNDITTSECLAAIARHQGQANALRTTFAATEASEM